MDSIGLFFPLPYILMREHSNRILRRNVRKSKKNIMELPDETFVKNFRLNKRAFQYVLSIVEMNLPPPRRNDALSRKDKLIACLRFFGEGSLQQGVGQDFNVGIAQPTFSKVLQEILDVLELSLCPKWITLKMSPEEKLEAKHWFYDKCGLPGVVMCVDGTHIPLKTPYQNPHLFYNRKGYHSLNTTLICNHKQWITYVDASYPGSSHDSFVWSNTEASSYFENIFNNGERNLRLLGDGGYALFPWLLTPYRNVEAGSQQSKFNAQHCKGRNIIERTIGVLKSRFRCLDLSRVLQYSPQKSAQVINVCCALHNICKHFQVSSEEDLLYDDEENRNDTANDTQESEVIQHSQYYAAAESLRNEIMMSL